MKFRYVGSFIQTKPGLSHKHAGTVQAPTAELALQNARDVYTRHGEGTSIWVVPQQICGNKRRNRQRSIL